MAVIYNQDFRKIYEDEILPVLMETETVRKQNFIELMLIESFFVAAIIGVIVLFFRCNDDTIKYMVAPYVFIALIIFFFYIAYSYNKDFVELWKAAGMNRILKYFNGMKYTEKFPFKPNEMSGCNLFSTYNSLDSGDKFIGEYNDVKYKIAETHMQYITGSGRDKRVHQIFKGVIVSFPMNKFVRENTIVATKSDRMIKNNAVGLWSAFFGVVASLFGYFALGMDDIVMVSALFIALAAFGVLGIVALFEKDPLQEVKLEDPVFAKKFKVYSADQVEARYLVTTAFMERFLKLNTAFGAKKAKCAFYGGDIIFAISTNKNLFEIGNLFRPLNDIKQMDNFYCELSSILDMIDYFKLDERTGL